jgi:hypothetical protein
VKIQESYQAMVLRTNTWTRVSIAFWAACGSPPCSPKIHDIFTQNSVTSPRGLVQRITRPVGFGYTSEHCDTTVTINDHEYHGDRDSESASASRAVPQCHRMVRHPQASRVRAVTVSLRLRTRLPGNFNV